MSFSDRGQLNLELYSNRLKLIIVLDHSPKPTIKYTLKKECFALRKVKGAAMTKKEINIMGKNWCKTHDKTYSCTKAEINNTINFGINLLLGVILSLNSL